MGIEEEVVKPKKEETVKAAVPEPVKSEPEPAEDSDESEESETEEEEEEEEWSAAMT